LGNGGAVAESEILAKRHTSGRGGGGGGIVREEREREHDVTRATLSSFYRAVCWSTLCDRTYHDMVITVRRSA
jgi:hypothetical protein